jgi:hypothetical protein
MFSLQNKTESKDDTSNDVKGLYKVIKQFIQLMFKFMIETWQFLGLFIADFDLPFQAFRFR